MDVKAKICGLRRASDAAHAVRHGAGFLGVVLDSGPRQASPDEVRAVVEAAGSIPVMAVVVTTALEDVLRFRDVTGFTGVQLHGGQDATQARRYAEEGLLVWRTARLAAESDTAEIGGISDSADAVLVEPFVLEAAGGTGVALDLGLALEARRRLEPKRMVLAGGLTPESVGPAAALVGPYAVDVSSGVERAPGVKDPDRVMRFLEALHDISSRA